MSSGPDSVNGKDDRLDKDARRARRRGGPLGGDANLTIDYKDPQFLRYFITDRGKISPRRVTGLNAKQQRALTTAIKRARNIGFLPFTTNS